MSSRRKQAALEYSQPTQMGVVQRLEQFSWLSWAIAAALFLGVFSAAADNAFPAALLELFMQLPLLVAWLTAAFGWGGLLSWVGRTFLSVFAVHNKTGDRQECLSYRKTGPLAVVTSAALGLGTMSLATLGLGLIGALNRPVAFGMVLVGVAIALSSIVRAKPTLSTRVPLMHWPWLAVVPLIAIVTLCALLPAGLLWGMDEPNGYDVVGYHLQVPREWYEAGRIFGLHHNVYSYFPFNVEMHYLLAMHLTGGPWAGQFLAQLMHGVYVGLSVVAVYAAVRPYGQGRAIAAGLLAAAPPWMPMLGSIAYNEGGLLLYGTLAVAWVMHGLSPSPVIPGEGGVRVLPRDKSTSPIEQNPHPTLSRNTGRGTELAIAGVMAGLAAGCKLTAVPILIVGLAVAVLAVNWRAWKGVGVFVVAAVLIFSPWLIRNAVWTGTPVFPEMQSVLGRGHFSQAQADRWHKAHKPRPDQQAMTTRIAELGRHVFADWRFAYGVVPLGIVAMLLSLRRRESRVLLILLSVLTIFWLTQTHLQGRFYVLAIPLAAIAVGQVRSRYWSWTTSTLTVILLLIGTGSVFMKLHSIKNEYSNRGIALTTLSGFTGIDQTSSIGPTLPPEDLVVLVGDAQAFLYQLPMTRLYYRTVFDVDTSSGVKLTDAYLKDVPRNRRRHLSINLGELGRFHRTYGLPNWMDQEEFIGVTKTQLVQIRDAEK